MNAIKTGVWLDLKKAIIIKTVNNELTTKIILSGIEPRKRDSGEGNKYGRFAKQFLSFEKSKERKQAEKEKKYFQEIIKEISNSDEIILFGPSSSKNKLEKELLSHKALSNKRINTKDADSMTDNQVVAWVSNYYSI